jgi:hypothetical protein
MKTKILLMMVVIFFAFSCEKEDHTYIKPLKEISACGYDDPLNQLDWLNLKIHNGKDPSNTNFIENIWIKEYEGEDVIIIDFGLTSSMYSTFDCSGNSINIDNQDFFDSLNEDELIYKYVIES